MINRHFFNVCRGFALGFCLTLPPINIYALPPLPPMPEIPKPLPQDSVPMGADEFPGSETGFAHRARAVPADVGVHRENYPGTPDWLRQAKFGIWVHFGPQASGESGDWYARKMYVPGTPAYQNHLKNTALRPNPATRKSCAIGIPPS